MLTIYITLILIIATVLWHDSRIGKIEKKIKEQEKGRWLDDLQTRIAMRDRD